MTSLPSDYLYPPTPEQEQLLGVMLDIQIPPPQRAEAGRQLAALGDPRRGVGVLPNGVPDLVWCEVAGRDAGNPDSFIGGDTEAYHSLPAQTVSLDTYWIAKYPITYQQFQAFAADNGYDTAEWWEGLTRYSYYDQEFRYSNHPRETVAWDEAMAFCRWLSAKTGADIRLPTEEEWEKAARGEAMWWYPWGDHYESGRATIYEWDPKVGEYYLKTTTAVGLYPHGASPYGALDMAGNVWEWTVSAVMPRIKQIEQHESFAVHDPKASRILKGGAWDESDVLARSASRSSALPLGRNSDIGFRVCTSTTRR